MGTTECLPTSIDNYSRNFKHDVLNQNYLFYSINIKIIK